MKGKTELLGRGHQVTGIARNPGTAQSRPGLVLKAGDVKKEAEMAELFAGHDVVIHSGSEQERIGL